MSTFSKCESSTYPIRTLFVDSPEPGDGLLAKSLLWPDRERHKRTTFAVAVCAELFVLAAITGHNSIAMVLGSGCAWGLWWQYRRETSMASEGDRSSRRRRRPAGMLLLLGITITVWTWYLWPVRRHLLPGAGNRSHARNRTSASQRDLSWEGVILWPTLPRKANLPPPPRPHLQSTSAGRMTKPLIIPFSGAYWFFKAPAEAPGARAHVAHESPTGVIIRSSDWHRLMMEAHQELGAPIELSCCRAIELAIRNGDSRPGRIDIAMKLIDSSTKQSENLGSRLVLSSMMPNLSMDRPAVDEVLHYRIPASPHIRQFDQIQIVFEPSQERSFGGVQIAIQEFRLLPEY